MTDRAYAKLGACVGVMDAPEASGIPVDVAAERIVESLVPNEPAIAIAGWTRLHAREFARTDPRAPYALPAEILLLQTHPIFRICQDLTAMR